MSFKKAYTHMRTQKKPSGWYTRDEVATDMGICADQAGRKLGAMKKAGLVESMRWTEYDEDGNHAPSRLYRLVKK